MVNAAEEAINKTYNESNIDGSANTISLQSEESLADKTLNSDSNLNNVDISADGELNENVNFNQNNTLAENVRNSEIDIQTGSQVEINENESLNDLNPTENNTMIKNAQDSSIVDPATSGNASNKNIQNPITDSLNSGRSSKAVTATFGVYLQIIG